MIHKTGPPGCMNWEDWHVPDTGLGEVRMRHTALGVNYADLDHHAGISHPWPVPDEPVVIGFEGVGVVDAYRRAAKRTQLAPEECLLVACHPFDLDAAAKVGVRTALVRRPAKWGDNPPERPAIPPHGTYDIDVNSIAELSG